MGNVLKVLTAFADLKLPPGPKGFPLLGNALQIKRDPLGFLTECARTYGDVVRISLRNQLGFLINHPDDIEAVLSTNGQNFVKSAGGTPKRPSPKRVNDDLMTWVRNFPSDGETWLPERELAQPSHRERRQIQPAFHGERIAGYAEVMVAFTQRMLAGWQHGEIRDIHREMTHLALAIVAKTLFNADADGAAQQLAAAFETIIAQIVSQMVNPLQVPVGIPTPRNLSLRRAVAQVERFFGAIVEDHRAHGDHGDLMSMLLDAQGEDGAIDRNDWRYQAMTVFVAGYETTALALTWSWYLLAQRPEVEAKLAAELQTVLDGRTPHAADFPKLRYTEMVIKETLRLYPPVWLLGPRLAFHAYDFGGYRLPAGSMVLISPWVIHRDPRYFEHPEVFDPDRWADGRARQMPKYAYFPFSGGQRHCVGHYYAMMEAVLVLATIAQSFRLQRTSGAPITPQPLVTLQPREGMPMLLTRR